MKKKLILIILLVIVGIISVASVTYAIYTWAISEDVTGGAECFKVNYLKGQDIGSENEYETLMPSDDYTGGLSATVTVSLDSSCTITNGIGTLYLNTDSSTSEALLNSGALKYQVIKDDNTLLDSGSISSIGQLIVKDNITINTTATKYTVVVWLDSNALTVDTMEQLLSSLYMGNISMSIESGDLQ